MSVQRRRGELLIQKRSQKHPEAKRDEEVKAAREGAVGEE
jgi:hypothetical protein